MPDSSELDKALLDATPDQIVAFDTATPDQIRGVQSHGWYWGRLYQDWSENNAAQFSFKRYLDLALQSTVVTGQSPYDWRATGHPAPLRAVHGPPLFRGFDFFSKAGDAMEQLFGAATSGIKIGTTLLVVGIGAWLAWQFWPRVKTKRKTAKNL